MVCRLYRGLSKLSSSRYNLEKTRENLDLLKQKTIDFKAILLEAKLMLKFCPIDQNLAFEQLIKVKDARDMVNM